MITRNVKYQGISLPVSTIDKIKEHMKKSGNPFSVTSFIKESITEKIYRETNPGMNREEEIKAFFSDYIDEKFKEEFEGKSQKIFQKMMKRKIDKKVKKDRKKKN